MKQNEKSYTDLSFPVDVVITRENWDDTLEMLKDKKFIDFNNKIDNIKEPGFYKLPFIYFDEGDHCNMHIENHIVLVKSICTFQCDNLKSITINLGDWLYSFTFEKDYHSFWPAWQCSLDKNELDRKVYEWIRDEDEYTCYYEESLKNL